MKNIVFIISMHRSGSSLFTKCLETCGVKLGHNLMNPQADNPKGFFEDQEIVQLNEEILKVMDYQWSLINHEHYTLSDSVQSDFKKQAINILVQRLSELSDGEYFAIKDPRLCRLAPFWFDICDELKIEYKIIFLVREPNWVANSLNKRNKIPYLGGYSLWLDYLNSSLCFFKKTTNKQIMYLRFDDFIHNMNERIISVAKFLDATINIVELNDYLDNFYEPALLSSHSNHPLFNSNVWKEMLDIESGQVISQDKIINLNQLISREQDTKKALLGAIQQLNWHRKGESESLRIQIELKSEKISQLESLNQSFEAVLDVFTHRDENLLKHLIKVENFIKEKK